MTDCQLRGDSAGNALMLSKGQGAASAVFTLHKGSIGLLPVFSPPGKHKALADTELQAR